MHSLSVVDEEWIRNGGYSAWPKSTKAHVCNMGRTTLTDDDFSTALGVPAS
jgi:hypothetical protein